jgi:hypothetical protein
MYVHDVAENYTFSMDEPARSEPGTDWGIAAGACFVLFEYVSGFGYVLQADEAQVRLGIALRSRGGDE